jgi:hypothetical protein
MNWSIPNFGNFVSSVLFELLGLIQVATLSSASHHDSGIPSQHYLILVDHLFSTLFPSCERGVHLSIPIFGTPSSLRFWVDDSQITTPRETHHPDESWFRSRSDMLLRRAFRNQTLSSVKMPWSSWRPLPAHQHGITEGHDPFVSAGCHPDVNTS